MVEPFPQAFGEADDLRNAALDQHIEVQRNPAFEFGQAEQRLHQEFRIDRARLRLDHEPDVFGGFIADIADQRQLLLVEKLGDLLDQPRLLHQPRNFGDDDHPGAARALFLLPLGADAERAAAGDIGFGDGFLGIDDDAAGRKIRTLDPFQKRLRFRIRLVDQMQRRFAKFGGVVRRDRGRHADRNALRAVGEQIREAAGEDRRLLAAVVVGRLEFDRVFVDAFEQ